jgi:hypothetical protein
MHRATSAVQARPGDMRVDATLIEQALGIVDAGRKRFKG